MVLSMVMTCAMAEEDGASATVVQVSTGAELKTALADATYDPVTIQLTADINMTSSTLITSIAPSDVTIDGQGKYTLSAPSGSAGAYTLFAISKPSGKSLTFQDLTIDAGNQQLLSLSGGSDTTLTFSGATLQNLYGSSANNGGVTVAGSGTGNEITCGVAFENTTASGTGTLLTVRYADLAADGSSFTTSALEGGAVINLRAGGASYQCQAVVTDSAVAWTDEDAGGLFNGIAVNGYWTLTLDGGSTVTGAETYTPEETYKGSDTGCAAVYAAASSNLILNDCTISNSDGSDARIRLISSSAPLQADGR
ncbi:MAG: hypothetical protein LUF68_06215, partial [Clostridiales bacterium]|nr:hypothetical protein [Clostridiales bacterium]